MFFYTILYSFAISLFTLNSASATSPNVPSESTIIPSQEAPQKAPEKWCILGGARGIGWALAQELSKHEHISTTLLVRDKKKSSAKVASFQKKPLVVSCDVTHNLETIITHAKDANFIVIAQSFPYKVWEKSLYATVENALTAAQKTGATLIFYTQPYRYGVQPLINEESPVNAISMQGKVLDKVETRIEDAAQAGFIKARIVCHSYPYGPNVGDGMLDKNFDGIAHNKKRGFFQSKQDFEWVGNGKNRLQLSYTPDLARATTQYVHHEKIKELPFHRINYAGESIANINQLGMAYAQAAHETKQYKLSLYGKSELSFLGMMRAEATRAYDLYDSFEKEVFLDDLLFKTLCNNFKVTPVESAVTDIYNYYTTD